jgi:hypothetical protein
VPATSIGGERGWVFQWQVAALDVVEERRDTEVHVIPGTGHCALGKLDEVGPLMIGGLNRRLSAYRDGASAPRGRSQPVHPALP